MRDHEAINIGFPEEQYSFKLLELLQSTYLCYKRRQTLPKNSSTVIKTCKLLSRIIIPQRNTLILTNQLVPMFNSYLTRTHDRFKFSTKNCTVPMYYPEHQTWPAVPPEKRRKSLWVVGSAEFVVGGNILILQVIKIR